MRAPAVWPLDVESRIERDASVGVHVELHHPALDAFREALVVRNLRPGYSIEDFLSSFRVLRDQERMYRLAAQQIDVG